MWAGEMFWSWSSMIRWRELGADLPREKHKLWECTERIGKDLGDEILQTGTVKDFDISHQKNIRL